ncbi:MAG: tetratricopeptide repeat protein, partial [Deltaproteobacteria bacterium]|nr:tetratricopeptide repeat protein [Deltaproteobacteria bacterium]
MPTSVLLAALLLMTPSGVAVAKAGGKARSSEKSREAKKASEKKSDSSTAEVAFAEAKKAHESLRKDAKRRKFRDQWMAVAEKYEAVANQYPSSPRAADSLYNAAGLYAELSRVSLARRDLKQAIEAYARLCEKYPRSTLADDAHLALGKIYRDRKGDTSGAEAQFRAAAACKGDMQQKAKVALAELASLPKPSKTDKPSSSVEDKPKLAQVEARRPLSADATSHDDEDEDRGEPEAKTEEPTVGSRAAEILSKIML